MMKAVSVYVGLRYLRASRSGFLSFMTWASLLGIALGVMVLITVLSVMNGFDHEIHARLFHLARHVVVTKPSFSEQKAHTLGQRFSAQPGISGVAPYLDAHVMLSAQGQVYPVLLSGILPAQEARVSPVLQSIRAGRWQALQAGQFGVIIGAALAKRLGLQLGDKLMVIAPRAQISVIGILPVFKRFTVKAIFQTEKDGNPGPLGYDAMIIMAHLQDVQALLQVTGYVSGLRLAVTGPYAAPRIAQRLLTQLPATYLVRNWTEQHRAFFHAIRMEKTMMFFILSLIVMVALFNLVSSLVMLITDKRADIAILRTLGATPGLILRIFLVQGTAIAALGTALGIASGTLLSYYASPIVKTLERLLQVHFLSSTVYFIDFLPSQLRLSDVLWVCGLTLSLSVLATLYPAWRAAQVHPADVLRYE